MIRVSRRSTDKTGKRISPGQGWFIKARKATRQIIARGGPGDTRFNEGIYAADSVRVAFDKLFHGKCAYCEFPLARVDVHVEHYRPKGAVYEAPSHPGYYWLAYDWSNLLPACPACNTKRREPPHAGSPTRGQTATGKADQFPLADEADRATKPDDSLTAELRLIVDPTRDEPSRYLTFDMFGAPLAKGDSGSLTHVRGEATITICSLDQYLINRERSKVIRDMVCLIQLKRTLKSEPSSPTIRKLQLQVRNLIRRKTSAPENFAGAARAVLQTPEAFALMDETPEICDET